MNFGIGANCENSISSDSKCLSFGLLGIFCPDFTVQRDEVELRLKTAGMRPTHVEGYRQAEWILLDYVDFVVHVFSEKARKFYDLERLWKTARRLEPSELKAAPRQRKVGAAPARKKKKKRA